jgi:hypothetical protein
VPLPPSSQALSTRPASLSFIFLRTLHISLLFAFPSIAGKLDREGLVKYLVDVHGLLIAVGKYVKKESTNQEAKKKKKQKRSALGDKDANRSLGRGRGQRGNDEEGLKM